MDKQKVGNSLKNPQFSPPPSLTPVLHVCEKVCVF